MDGWMDGCFTHRLQGISVHLYIWYISLIRGSSRGTGLEPSRYVKSDVHDLLCGTCRVLFVSHFFGLGLIIGWIRMGR
jgi:hypothetical protein